MIDLMVLAKSVSSLTDTQMINKLDHAKSEKGEKEKKKRVRKKKEIGRKHKTQREEEKQSKEAQVGKRERREGKK